MHWYPQALFMVEHVCRTRFRCYQKKLHIRLQMYIFRKSKCLSYGVCVCFYLLLENPNGPGMPNNWKIAFSFEPPNISDW